MRYQIDPAPGAPPAGADERRDFPILGEWPYDEETVGMGFFPEEVALRPTHSRQRSR